jgi:hypothetical protein
MNDIQHLKYQPRYHFSDIDQISFLISVKYLGVDILIFWIFIVTFGGVRV